MTSRSRWWWRRRRSAAVSLGHRVTRPRTRYDSAHEARHRRTPQRGQDHGLQRAHQRQRAGDRLRLLRGRGQPRRRAGARRSRSTACTRRSRRPSACTRRSTWSTSPAWPVARAGEGLGARFLADIRGVDAVAHVVRGFDNPEVAFVRDRIDPMADVQDVETELILSDVELVERRRDKTAKAARSGDKAAQKEMELLARITATLEEGGFARTVERSQGRGAGLSRARAGHRAAGAVRAQHRRGPPRNRGGRGRRPRRLREGPRRRGRRPAGQARGRARRARRPPRRPSSAASSASPAAASTT